MKQHLKTKHSESAGTEFEKIKRRKKQAKGDALSSQVSEEKVSKEEEAANQEQQ